MAMEHALEVMAGYKTFEEFSTQWDTLGWEQILQLPVSREECLEEMQKWWDGRETT